MNYEQSNVGLGLVPHRKGCRCDECTVDVLRAELAATKARLAEALRDRNEALHVCYSLQTQMAAEKYLNQTGLVRANGKKEGET